MWWQYWGRNTRVGEERRYLGFYKVKCFLREGGNSLGMEDISWRGGGDNGISRVGEIIFWWVARSA